MSHLWNRELWREPDVQGAYLDGTLEPACQRDRGCDVAGCRAFPPDPSSAFHDALVAREFVQVGQASAPTCDPLDAGTDRDASSDAGVRQVPDVESRAPAGPIGVQVRYYRDSGCPAEDEITVVVPVE